MARDDGPVAGRLTLIGQYDSPFVRRSGIALMVAGIPFVHLPWSVFGDAGRLRRINSLVRVPTLVLEDGGVLVDSHGILDHIDRRGAVPLRPMAGAARNAALHAEGLAVGMAEKAVGLFYEYRMHREAAPAWAERCRGQIEGTARALDALARDRPVLHWFEDRLSHADIAAAVAWRFTSEAHPGLLDADALPALAAHAAALEALAPFRAISQDFVPPD